MMSTSPRRVRIEVPKDAVPGDTLEIVVQRSAYDNELESNSHLRETLSGYVYSARQTVLCMTLFYVLFEVSGLILLCFVVALNAYASLTFSSSCNMLNPITGLSQNTFFMNLFFGFTSNRDYCKNNEEDFCLNWNDNRWVIFTSDAGIGSSYYYTNTSRALYAAQVMVGLALGFASVSTIFHCLILFEVCNGYDYVVYTTAAWSALLAFIMAIAALSNTTTAPPFLSFFWRGYVQEQGGDMTTLLAGTNPDAVNNDPLCTARVSYIGGSILAAAVVLLFIVALWSLCSSCFTGPIAFEQLTGKTKQKAMHGDLQLEHERLSQRGRELLARDSARDGKDEIPPPESTDGAWVESSSGASGSTGGLSYFTPSTQSQSKAN